VAARSTTFPVLYLCVYVETKLVVILEHNPVPNVPLQNAPITAPYTVGRIMSALSDTVSPAPATIVPLSPSLTINLGANKDEIANVAYLQEVEKSVKLRIVMS
jgi:hypothetical protein